MTAMTAAATTYFTLNFLNKTIVGTKASFNKASKGVGAEYEELAAKMKAHPEYVIEFKVPKHRSTKAKRSYYSIALTSQALSVLKVVVE